MKTALLTLLQRLDEKSSKEMGIIPWSCPVPAFGNLSNARVATLGINPSNREFVDNLGRELSGGSRRFHTLNSLGLECWSEAKAQHLQLILHSCMTYFSTNPYDGWFKQLDFILGETSSSYYPSLLMGDGNEACHLDLIPYATSSKWTSLTPNQRELLLSFSGNVLGLLLRDSPVTLLVLNGSAVVNNFQSITGMPLEKKIMKSWVLPRQSQPDVKGIAYIGKISQIAGVKLNRQIAVAGYNHNLQSSFGVTRSVRESIRHWVGQVAGEVLK
jgi:hypothetical protein